MVVVEARWRLSLQPTSRFRPNRPKGSVDSIIRMLLVFRLRVEARAGPKGRAGSYSRRTAKCRDSVFSRAGIRTERVRKRNLLALIISQSMKSDRGLRACISTPEIQKKIRALKPCKLLQELVSIASSSGDEYRAACFVENYLLRHGIRVRRQQVQSNRFNLVASIGRRTRRPHILFNTHIDTVPAFARKALCPSLRGGLLYGRGACDAKGNVAAMAAAFLALAQQPLRDRPHLTLAIMVGEENSGDGVARFTRSYRDFNWAVVGEPTGLGIARTQSGYMELEIEVFSSPCHGFDPISEQSAVALAALVRDCREMVNDLSRQYPHSLFVRSFAGGGDDSFWYTRPYCRARLLFNPFPDSTQRAVIDGVRRLARRIEHLYSGTRIKATVVDADNGLTTSKRSQSVRALCSGLRAIGEKPAFPHLPSWTDGSTLNDVGIETVIFGPGDLKNAHTNAECVPILEVEKAALVLALACMNQQPKDSE